MQPLTATHFTDPGCPWAYSARPYHARLRWRFGDQLDWRLVMIGLTERPEQYEARGFTPERAAAGQRLFERRFGMPFAHLAKDRVSATSPACRAIVAAREQGPEDAETALRALQLLQFTTDRRLDDAEALAAALTAAGLDGRSIAAQIEDEDVWSAYEADRALARTAEGTPTHAQDRTSASDGPVRYTAPSVIFSHPDGRTLEVGGFQPFESYDTALANLEPRLQRRPEPAGPVEALSAFPGGLTTAELAEVLRSDLAPRDLEGTRRRLDELQAEGEVIGEPLGGDALWRLVRAPVPSA